MADNRKNLRAEQLHSKSLVVAVPAASHLRKGPLDSDPKVLLAKHLSWVAEQWKQSGQSPSLQRDAMMQWLASNLDFLRSVKASHEQRMPGMALLLDMMDLTDGIQSPRLTKRKVDRRPADPTCIWATRAHLSAAVDARQLAGDPPTVAAKFVARKFGRLGLIRSAGAHSTTGDGEWLLTKRDEFNAETAGPADGSHRVVWSTYKVEFMAIVREAAPGFQDHLRAWAEMAIEKAAATSGTSSISD